MDAPKIDFAPRPNFLLPLVWMTAGFMWGCTVCGFIALVWWLA